MSQHEVNSTQQPLKSTSNSQLSKAVFVSRSCLSVNNLKSLLLALNFGIVLIFQFNFLLVFCSLFFITDYNCLCSV